MERGAVAEWSWALLSREKLKKKSKESLVHPPAWAKLKKTIGKRVLSLRAENLLNPLCLR